MTVTPDNATVVEDSTENTAFVARTYYLDVLVRNMCRQYFEENRQRGYEGIRDLFWLPDNRTDGGSNRVDSMVIDLVDAWNPSRIGVSPAIYVKANDFGSTRLGIGDSNQFPNSDFMSGDRVYTRAWVGSLTVFCVGQVPRQLRLVALSIAEHLQQFSREIAQGVNIKKFEIQKIGAIKPLQEQPTYLASPIFIDYGFLETWFVRPDMRRLDKIRVTARPS